MDTARTPWLPTTSAGANMERLLKEEAGAAASEYAILVAIIAAIIAAAVIQFDLTGLFVSVAAKVRSAMG